MLKWLIQALLCVSTFQLEAQYVFSLSNEIPVSTDSSGTLLYPWAGGLNNPQFSTLDLNLDGIDDLLVFDRNGSKNLSFIRSNFIDTIDFSIDMSISSSLPDFQNWAQAIDYNCDNLQDIFTYKELGITVYRNVSSNQLNFIKYRKGRVLQSDYGSGEVNLLVSGNDIPAITDIDNDGDLDVLTFSFFNGDLVEYHQNQSMELYGTCDSLEFLLIDACWGNVMENSNTNAVTLGISCKGKSSSVSTGRHIGSTLTAIDIDYDNDKDLLVGDISFKKLTLLINGGDSLNANITIQDPDFPISNIPVDVDLFPAAFYLDVNNDSRKDLVVAPNSLATEDLECSWLYLDLSNDSNANFALKTNSFIVDEMIDVGTAAYPAQFDYNYDQKPDILIGNGYRYSDNNKIGQIDAYVNTGTVNSPEFHLFREDISNISSFGWNYLCPTFGDLDGDSDMDMIIGVESGEIHYFEHIIGIYPEPIFIHNDSFLSSTIIDIGSFAAPQLFDMNNDSLLDLIIGESNGRVNYYENVGNQAQPQFSLVSNFFGEVDVSSPQSNGFSVPHLFSSNGEINLLVGSEQGELFLYGDIENNLSSKFSLESTDLAGYQIGSRSAAFIWNFNNDAYSDIVCGNLSGGLNLLKGEMYTSVTEQSHFDQVSFYPNPVNSILNIGGAELLELVMYAFNGYELIRTTDFSDRSLNLSHLPAGFYIVKYRTAFGEGIDKIIKIP